ncbi:MAG: hypothetical protein AB1490_23625 [Pseudomonadota bacterium]
MESHFASEKSIPVRRFAIDLALLACLSIAAFVVAAVTALAPRDPASGVAVVFAPWTGADAALSRAVEAKARFVRFGGASFIAVVIPDDADYQARVLNAGAWLVLDPQALAACLPFLDTAARGS